MWKYRKLCILMSIVLCCNLLLPMKVKASATSEVIKLQQLFDYSNDRYQDYFNDALRIAMINAKYGVSPSEDLKKAIENYSKGVNFDAVIVKDTNTLLLADLLDLLSDFFEEYKNNNTDEAITYNSIWVKCLPISEAERLLKLFKPNSVADGVSIHDMIEHYKTIGIGTTAYDLPRVSLEPNHFMYFNGSLCLFNDYDHLKHYYDEKAQNDRYPLLFARNGFVPATNTNYALYNVCLMFGFYQYSKDTFNYLSGTNIRDYNYKVNDDGSINYSKGTWYNAYTLTIKQDSDGILYSENLFSDKTEYIQIFESENDASNYANLIQQSGLNIPLVPYNPSQNVSIDDDNNVTYDNDNDNDGGGDNDESGSSGIIGKLDIIIDYLKKIYHQTIVNNVLEVAQLLYDVIKDIISSASSAIETVSETIKDVFPFCVIFDMELLLQFFDAEPIAPKFEIPFVYEKVNINEKIVIDFAMFDTVVAYLRWIELILFMVALMKFTFKAVGLKGDSE